MLTFRFVVDVLISKKVIVFPLLFLFLYIFFFSFSFFKTREGEGEGSRKEETC